MTGLVVEIAEKAFPGADGAASPPLYKDFRLEIADRAFVALLGPSGLGKTTLLNMIAGVDKAFTGKLDFINGKTPRIGYVFQSPRLLPWRTVLQNVALPLPEGPDSLERARAAIADVGLAGSEDVYPERLSLGMQRRVALARGFAIEPELLVMDEPFVSLDEANTSKLHDLLNDLIAARPTTTLFVTHDSREAVRLADRIVVLEGPPARIARDITVPLSRDARRIPGEIERVRDQVVARLQPVAAANG
jgi:NitT/TauT family transport system ATP-binding protein